MSEKAFIKDPIRYYFGCSRERVNKKKIKNDKRRSENYPAYNAGIRRRKTNSVFII